jgi:hypothetical protein
VSFKVGEVGEDKEAEGSERLCRRYLYGCR